MDSTVLGHLAIALINLVTAIVAYKSGKRSGRNGH